MNINTIETAIILVNWNRSIDTINCINSIKLSNYHEYKIIVVDNNSSDKEREILQSLVAECEIFYLDQNTGYTGGNNFGIKVALQLGARYIFLLNNDTFLAETALERLVDTMNSIPEVAITSPKIYFYPETNLLWSGAPRFDNLFLMGYLKGYREIDNGQCDLFEYVEYVSGCAMMIRASIFKDVSLLSDQFFAVCEDLDFCFRVKGIGFKIAYEPSAVIYHIESASSGGSDGPQYVYYQTRNYLLFHELWYKNILHLIISQIYYIFFMIKRATVFILTGKWRAFIGILLGIIDYFLRRFGARPYPFLNK